MKYIKRYVDEELKDVLECIGAVLILGLNGGKTTTSTQFAETIIDLQHPNWVNHILNWQMWIHCYYWKGKTIID